MQLSRDLMLGMLRKGSNGKQILEILNVVVADVREQQILEILNVVVADVREQLCEDLGIADCPENENEIADAMKLFPVQ